MVYDVGEKRVSKALKVGRRYLSWVQNSVFEGELSPALYQQLKADMGHLLDKDHDSVIFYKLNYPWNASVERWGKQPPSKGMIE